MRQAAAVDVRISLDLRVGAAFTRLQTMGLQGRLPELEQKVISYGESPDLVQQGYHMNLYPQDHVNSRHWDSSSINTNESSRLCPRHFGTSISNNNVPKARSSSTGVATTCSTWRRRLSCMSNASKNHRRRFALLQQNRRPNGMPLCLSVVLLSDTSRRLGNPFPSPPLICRSLDPVCCI